MKKILKISLVLLTFIGFVSCDSTDDDTSYLDNRTPVAYFVPGNSGTLLVEEEAPAVYTVTVGISEAQATDRSYVVSVDPSSTAQSGVDYSINLSNLVIPAGSVVGTFTVTGIYAGTTLAGSSLKLNLDSVEETSVLARSQFNLSIFRSCPVDSDFLTGSYMMQQISGTAPFGIGSAFGGNQIVDITADANTRTFNYVYAPGSFDSPYFMTLDLICGNVFVSGTIQPGNGTLGCGNGSIGQSTGSTPGTYDSEDDSEVTVNILDFEPDSGCATNYEAVIKLIKQ
ncbi:MULTISPECIES: hypothetical protein [Meridianimaribacter]|uniref:DUF1735 domain-containing protein n=1 Tax=Meridianimaribacter flavus TaxID=571115 RepID=A0ABY2G2I8_9FLAO|nr:MULTISPECIES: hypothetical protein [Meridianimaribacter]TBV25039.1 hypothetical protein DMZ43_14305 [Meridianimaribacter sp. CL38]TDY10212.1 hypothetical protein A8975_2626 [Meridianimaribacter flavus]